MSSLEFEPVRTATPVNALQGVGTNALVDNPFTFDEVAEAAPVNALQGVGTNALIDNPFAFES